MREVSFFPWKAFYRVGSSAKIQPRCGNRESTLKSESRPAEIGHKAQNARCTASLDGVDYLPRARFLISRDANFAELSGISRGFLRGPGMERVIAGGRYERGTAAGTETTGPQCGFPDNQVGNNRSSSKFAADA
ncbi:hypothetical protein HZH66_009644 [Vespula vulgaris]|uniref:Uncharacterized protein n=2 Tax=Vespula TaxID=7451 RepID=A0A834JMY4_VESVU|nr:hypothetical protein HZH66_009644 [Vespula vulgaris]